MIPYGRQDINQQDIDAVVEVLKSDFITQGPHIANFENALKKYVSSDYAFALNSATSALHVSCLALGLKENDWLWTTPISFVASANCGLYCGAKVDFVDIDPRTYNLCPIALKAKLEKAKLGNKLPKVVVAVHLSGQCCDMESIYLLAKQFGFFVIEDASHAIGAEYQGQKVGNCKYSDITVFSFHPVKIITTAEGGAVVTNDKELADRIELFRSHGVTRSEELMEGASHGPWYYQQVELGYNYRMTDIQAALGASQMKRLDEFVAKRHEIFILYNDLLSGLSITLPYQLPETYSALHLYVIRLHIDKIKLSHLEVFNLLRSKGVGVNLHYIPIHTQPYYKKMGFKEGDFPIAEKYYQEAISLPMYPGLSKNDQLKVVAILKEILDV